MAEVKQPKPFLKKGTRQYLSNATVRSLNQKPKVVDFGSEDGELQPRATITNSFKNESQQIKVQIKLNKPKPKKDFETKNTNSLAKENKNANIDKFGSQSSQSKKKNSVLEDYVTTVKDNRRDSIGKQKQPAPVKPPIQYEPKISMVRALKRQDESLQDDDSDEAQEKITAVKPPSVHMPSKNQTPSIPIPKKKVININLEDNQQVNFNSDSQDEAPAIKTKPAKPQVFPKPMQKKSRWDEEETEQEKVTTQQKGPSKILQKFYKKQQQPSNNSKPVIAQKKQTISDIPRELKQQIFNELLAQKHSDFTKKLQQLHQSITKSKKQRQALEQSSKQLAKDRQEFEKEMERRRKEFQEKVNAENSKLTRQKRYLKDQQTSGKADWRVKNEVEELRTKLQQSENEKKKMKASYNLETDRLKKKLEEQQQQIQALKGQIRCIEMQKIDLKTKSKQSQKKNEVAKQNNEIVRYWQDAPTRSYVSNFFQENFTLISLDPEYYDYEALEYYAYYLTKKDEISQLVSEERDSNGAKYIRKYKNGKQEDEYIGKLIRQIFPQPMKFTIIHYVNGDVKMVLPEGIIIYFDKKNQIIEWKVNPDKTILNFKRLGQIQMRYKSRRSGEIIELYKGSEMVRTQCGQSVRFRKNQKGDISRVGS